MKFSTEKALFLRVGWIGAHPSLTPLWSQDADGTHTQIWELASVHKSRNIESPSEADWDVGVLSGKGESGEHKQGTKFTGGISDISYASMHKWKLILQFTH